MAPEVQSGNSIRDKHLSQFTGRAMLPTLDVVRRLQEKFTEHLVAICLFGSAARDEIGPHSDLDFLVVLRQIPRTLGRRYEVYKPIHDVIASQYKQTMDITVIDIDEEYIENEDAEITPIMLNIAADAVILYDPTGKLSTFIARVRRLIEAAGLERYRTMDLKHGWKAKAGPLRAIEA